MSLPFPKLPAGYMAKSAVIVASGGTLLYGLIEYFTGNEVFHRENVMPLMLRSLGSDRTVKFNVWLAKYNLLPFASYSFKDYSELSCDVLGLKMKNPIGLSADFDKDGDAINGLRKSGLGFIELGSVFVTDLKSDTKSLSKQRDGKTDGGSSVSRLKLNLKKSFNEVSPVPLGININLIEKGEIGADYSDVFTSLGATSDFLTINYGIYRNDEKMEDLLSTLACVKKALPDPSSSPKILLKVPSTLSMNEMKAVAWLALNKGYIDGIIINDCSITNSEKLGYGPDFSNDQSSKVPTQNSAICIRNMYKLTCGKVPIIGCEGVVCGQDAYDKIRAGASLLQLNSSIKYCGFPVIGKVKRELAELLKRDGFSNISEAVGIEYEG